MVNEVSEATARKRINMIWANEAGVSVYVYEADHGRCTLEIHGVVNDYETVLATATIEKHNRDRLGDAVRLTTVNSYATLRATAEATRELLDQLYQQEALSRRAERRVPDAGDQLRAALHPQPEQEGK